MNYKFILTIFLFLLNVCLSGQNHINDTVIVYRYDTLNQEELDATYKFIDSINQEESVDFDNIYRVLASIISGEIPIGIFDFNLKNITNYNIGNGWKLGLGLETNEKMSNFISIGAFGNYWFKAKEFNYGGNLDFNLLTSKDMKLKFRVAHEFERLGNYGFEGKKPLLDPSNYKHFYVKATSLNNIISAEYSTFFNKYLKGFLKFEVKEKNILSDSQILRFSDSQFLRLSTLDFRLRIAFKEKFIQSGKTLRVEGNANPVIWLSYQKNLKGVFGSPYNFDKIEFKFKGKKEFKHLGETSLVAQAGYINGFAPVTELFNIEGSNENKFDVYCSESFSTMRPDEFFCDRFVALYFSHNFKHLLIDFKKFHPELIIVTNIAIGNCSYDSQILRFSDSQVLNKGYYESGLVIDNIISLGITKLGLGAFYRYGPYSYDEVWDNFVFKISICFGL